MDDSRSYPKAGSTPLLLRFRTPLERPTAQFAFDRQSQVNVLSGQGIPAVEGGLDVKSVPIVRGED